MSDSGALINLETYSISEMILFGAGGIGYVIVYGMVVWKIVRHKFVEVPAAAVLANVSWEFVWSWVYTTDFGSLYVFGYRAWFFLDVFIAWGVFRYGGEQFQDPTLKKRFRSGAVFSLLAWTVGVWLYCRQGYDIPSGLVSGYAITAFMSAQYVLLFIVHPNKARFSWTIAVVKWIAAALASIFCFMAFPENLILLWLCVLTFALDLWYVILFWNWRRRKGATVA